MNPHSSLDSSNIIFIGGIHGVGKSFQCAKACEQLGVTHLVAGDLLKAEKQQSAGTDKRVTSVGQNQDVLVRALERVLVGSWHTPPIQRCARARKGCRSSEERMGGQASNNPEASHGAGPPTQS